ncbi:MAG: T9SS type A sorting domain-containing protein [Bacteroidetes bacterium]|nr:T9SS type A sorting domain-containing protein [Bacteroidota bacterium]
MLKRTTIILSISLLTFTVSGQSIFQKTFGTTAYEEIWGLDKTYDGGFVLGGYTGFGNAYIIKLTAIGDTSWTRDINVGGMDLIYTIQQTNDSGFIAAGRTNGFGAGGLDMLLIKLDANGNNQWTKAIGGSADETVNSIEQTLDGGFIIAGNTYSFSSGLNDFYIVKTNSIGNIVWSKSIGGVGNDNAYSIIQNTDSSYIAVGLTSSVGAGGNDLLATKFDKNGNVTWMKTYGGGGDDRANSIQQTSDGGFIISGVTNSFGAGNYDFYLIKTDSSGNPTFQKTLGGVGNEWSYCVQQTNDLGYILTGYTTSFGAGSSDYYFIKTNSIGDTTWTKTFGGSMDDYATNVKQTPDNGYAIVGYGQSFGAGSHDFYFVKTDSNGNGICNQNTTATIVNSPISTVTIPTLTISSGGTVNSVIPILNSGTIVNTLCTNVGIEIIDKENVDINFFPNPLTDYATLNFENPENRKYIFNLYNVQGQLVRKIEQVTTETIILERQNLLNGLYFFQLITGAGVEMNGKLIIE